MPQNWWDVFPEVLPSPAAGSYPLPGLRGIISGPTMGLGPDPLFGAPRLGQAAGAGFGPSYLSGAPMLGQFPGSSSDQAQPIGYPQPSLAGGYGGPIPDRKAAVQQAAAAIRAGADPRAVRARLSQVGTGNTDFDPLDPFSDLLSGSEKAPGMMNPLQSPQPDAFSGDQPPFAGDSVLGRYGPNGLPGGMAAPMAASTYASNLQPRRGLVGPDGASFDRTGSFAGLQSGLDPGFDAAADPQNSFGTLLANQLGTGFNGNSYTPVGSVSDAKVGRPGDDFVNHMRTVIDSRPPDPAGRAQPLPPVRALPGPPAEFGSDGAIVVTGPPRAARDALRQGARLIRLSPEDILNIKKVLQTEWVQRAGTDQARGIVDTILNRLASGHWGSTISSVVNYRRAFSAINGPRRQSEGRHSVEEYPSSRVSRRVNDFVDSYLAQRANGAPSIIGTNLNYANPYVGTDPRNMPWVRRLEGPELGIGRAVHRHGTTPENQRYRPGPYSIVLPTPPGR